MQGDGQQPAQGRPGAWKKGWWVLGGCGVDVGLRQQCWQLERLPDRSTGFRSTQLFPGALLCSRHLALMHSSCGTTPLQPFAQDLLITAVLLSLPLCHCKTALSMVMCAHLLNCVDLLIAANAFQAKKPALRKPGSAAGALLFLWVTNDGVW